MRKLLDLLIVTVIYFGILGFGTYMVFVRTSRSAFWMVHRACRRKLNALF